MKIFIKVFFLVLFFTSESHAGVQLGAALGIHSSSFAGSTAMVSTTDKPQRGYGGGSIGYKGGLVALNQFSFLDLELDMFYSRRTVDGTSFQFIEIPLTLKYRILSWLALGSGVYYAIALGNINDNGTEKSYGELQYKQQDLGLIFPDIVAEIPLSETSDVRSFVSLRGLIGLNNVSTYRYDSRNFRVVELLFGIKVGL